MPEKSSRENQAVTSEIEFACYAQGAHTVYLAGTLNAWNPEANSMIRDEGSTWTTSVRLQPGRYEYKFVVDGVWCCRPGCHDLGRECRDCVKNDFDSMNRVIEVH